MATSIQAFVCLALLALDLASPFSISSHRSARNTDLADALAILQRQRRRVGVEDFLNSERILEERPLTLDDVTDWLSRTRGGRNEDEEGVDDDVISNGDWLSGPGRFNEFEPEPTEYDVGPLSVYQPTRIKASDNQVDDIFSDESSKSGDDNVRDKKVKEELVNPRGDVQENSKQNRSPSSSLSELDGEEDNSEALNSLTDEEVRVLMKAVGKLQQRASKMSKSKKSISSMSEIAESNSIGDELSPTEDREVIISEPVTEEQLSSVFSETDGPVTKEEQLVMEKAPGQEEPQVLEREIISEKLPNQPTLIRERELTNTVLPQAIEDELEAEQEEEEAENQMRENESALESAEEEQQEAEEEAAAAEEAEVEQKVAEQVEAEQAAEDAVAEEIANIEKHRLSPELISKYLLMNRDKFLLPQHGQGVKRTAKRASGLYANNMLNDDERGDDIGDDNGDVGVTLNALDSAGLIQAFVDKILALQNEIDGLKFKNSLEDLENDELTDALNEATIGQREGTVSNAEWKSLQHAIEIEQALQDLKRKESLTEEDNNIKAQVYDEGGDNADDDNMRKRGEPWKRKRGGDREEVDDYRSLVADNSSPLESALSTEDIERLLKSAYLMKEEADEEEEQGGEGEEEGIASLFLADAERCPAILEYSNNCELADLYNLPVDFEARALCNLHEMCYACGHSLSVSQSQCDLVYKAAVASLCHQKEVCVAESEIFLRTMKLKTRYIPHVQPSCRARCTAQFMGMF